MECCWSQCLKEMDYILYLIYPVGDMYMREFCNGKRHGFGKLQTIDKKIFVGNFVNKKKRIW